jgi:hypothetical protein
MSLFSGSSAERTSRHWFAVAALDETVIFELDCPFISLPAAVTVKPYVSKTSTCRTAASAEPTKSWKGLSRTNAVMFSLFAGVIG